MSEAKARALLAGAAWHCASCDAAHHGMFDLAAYAPDPWPGDHQRQANANLSWDGDFLSEDFCVIDGRHFMVRCILPIPVHGLADRFAFGCWGSLSLANFDAYVDGFDGGTYAGLGPWGSWLCNDLLGLVGATPNACRMTPREDRQRPTLHVADDNHPLAIMQRDGVTAEQVLGFYRHYGHAPA